MSPTQNPPQSRQKEQAERLTETGHAALDAAADQGESLASNSAENVNALLEVGEQAAANVRSVMQNNLESVSNQTRETIDRFARALGVSGEENERLALQSRQNMDAVARCGTVLTQAFQDTSQSWFELGRKQWQRNVDGFSRLARARSIQEFAAIQSEWLSDGMQQIVQDSRSIAERSLRAADEAGKALKAAARQNVAQSSAKPH